MRLLPSNGQCRKSAAPLHQLLAKGIAFDWTLKEKLVSPPIFTFPDFDKSFVLETDASIQGLGAVLSQKQADGKLHPVAYASRSLASNEERYAITDLETLAAFSVLSVQSPCHHTHRSSSSQGDTRQSKCIREACMHIAGARSIVLASTLLTSPTGQVERTTTLMPSPDSPASWPLQTIQPVHLSRRHQS